MSREGNNVRYYIENPQEKELADGFVEKTDDWENDLQWADIIIFDDVLGQGTKAERLREEGKLVIGGTQYSDRLEDERSFGQEELKKHRISIIPSEKITEYFSARGLFVHSFTSSNARSVILLTVVEE